MRLEVSGEGQVCAGDISTSSDFEIVNPELHLATLDSQDSRLFIEFNVEQGVGYQQAIQGEGADSLPVDVLPVDAIFSPVRKVNYNVERTRVGQVTDYERLVLEVWTDGTIKPVDAVRESAESLVNHFFLFSNLNKEVEPGVERSSLVVSPEVFQTPIDRLELSPRTLNCLKRAHITKVGEVLDMSDEDLLKIRNFGDKSLTELREKLAERGITADGGEAGGETQGSAGVISIEDIGELLQAGEGGASQGGLTAEPGGFTMEEGSEDEDSDDESKDDDQDETEEDEE
jgi:DNA-directed RNA polymerase subunit alpha